MIQYLTESMLMTAVSMVIALVIVALLLPGFNAITGKQLVRHIDGSLAVTIVAIVLVTGLIAGSYPALYLSGFRPIAVLKSTIGMSFSGLWIRRGLVVVQFCLSFAFIVGVLIVYKQVQYIQTKDLGFNKDNILAFGPYSKSSAPISPSSSGSIPSPAWVCLALTPVEKPQRTVTLT